MMSKEESKGDSGVEVMKNEKFRNDDMGEGWYTKKVYHFTKRFPGWVQMLLPTIDIIEESWNAFPKCKTSKYLMCFKIDNLQDYRYDLIYR